MCIKSIMDLQNQPIFVQKKNTKPQGEHVWIEPVSKGEFDVALGARVISKEAGGRIQVFFSFFMIDDVI